MSLWDIKISKLLTPTVVVIVLVVVVRWMTRPPQPLGAVMEVVGEKEHLFEVKSFFSFGTAHCID